MERWSIYCKKCGKFILTEEKDTRNEIHCVAGSYEDGYYLGAEDAFYCNDCASSLGLN
jgi:hypothetical protein